MLRLEMVGGRGGRNPDLWADRAWQDFMWGEFSFIIQSVMVVGIGANVFCRNGCDEGYGWELEKVGRES